MASTVPPASNTRRIAPTTSQLFPEGSSKGVGLYPIRKWLLSSEATALAPSNLSPENGAHALGAASAASRSATIEAKGSRPRFAPATAALSAPTFPASSGAVCAAMAGALSRPVDSCLELGLSPSGAGRRTAEPRAPPYHVADFHFPCAAATCASGGGGRFTGPGAMPTSASLLKSIGCSASCVWDPLIAGGSLTLRPNRAPATASRPSDFSLGNMLSISEARGCVGASFESYFSSSAFFPAPAPAGRPPANTAAYTQFRICSRASLVKSKNSIPASFRDFATHTIFPPASTHFSDCGS